MSMGTTAPTRWCGWTCWTLLDLPLVHYLEASYHVDGPRQTVKPSRGERPYARGGVVPSSEFRRDERAYPVLRYAWADTRAALQALAEDQPALQAVQVTYVNPETGADAQNILAYHALMLRPGQTLRLPARSPAMVLHAIEGAAEVEVGDQRFALAEADTCCAPGYTAVVLRNASATAPAFLFIADESPLHRKLGIHEVRS
jgi:gentisate 1,2-dioxygenase